MKTVIISQARMTSSRLPGKVLMKASGQPMLHYHVKRLQQSGLPIVIATTTNDSDQPIVDWCLANHVGYFRGDEHNVLSRYHEAAIAAEANTIIRVTSDCPLIDGSLVKKGLDQYLKVDDSYTFLSNTLQRTFPRGLDYAIFSRAMLSEAMSQATTDYQKEHVTPYFRQNSQGSFHHINLSIDKNSSHIRITLDTDEDLKLIKLLIEKYKADSLDYREIIQLFALHPELLKLNENVVQKK